MLLMKKYYYIDSCIYLNLWKREVDKKGNLLWRYAKELFDKIEEEKLLIYYLGYLLKELSYVIDKNIFLKKSRLFELSPNFKRITLSIEEYEDARKIEREIKESQISFFDIIHMLLTKKTNSILITRDKELIKICKQIQYSC